MAARPLIGVLVAAASIALTTLLLYPLSEIAPAVSLGVLYLLAVLLVSTVWGLRLGLATSVAAALAFNFFHIPPTGRFTIAEAENWVALVVFLVAAVVASTPVRARPQHAPRRRTGGAARPISPPSWRGCCSARPSRARRCRRPPSGSPTRCRSSRPPVVLERVEGDERHAAVPLGELGTLLVPVAAEEVARERVAPALEALLRAALEREALTREVVETSALRRSDEIKTAVLRSVSHDLRSPLTAIVAAADALASPRSRRPTGSSWPTTIAARERGGWRAWSTSCSTSRGSQAGTAEPREDWTSLEEVIRAAVEDTGARDRVKLAIAPDLPLIRADAGQLRRAIANLLENALRYGEGEPVSVRARVSGGRILMRVVDQGPGIPLAEQERIFAPFYRAPGAAGQGSGLGLAIVRGLLEANGGRVRVESLPGQGTSFVVELPLPSAVEAPA